MLCSRCLWLVSLTFTIAGGAVRAQQQPTSSPSQRTVTFRFDRQLETEVAEIYLAPGSSTTVHMPGPIRKGGFTLKGGEGRITAMQPQANPNVLVLLATGQIGPERIPAFVATADGKRYPFRLATLSGIMDSEVRVVSWIEEARDQRPSGDLMMEVLVQRKKLAVRSFETSIEGQEMEPSVTTAVRQGDRLYLQITRWRKLTDRPWKVQTATLLGVQGELWKVMGVQWGWDGKQDTNVILAEIPEGASKGSLTSIQLRGDDGVEVQLDGKGVLP